MNIPIELLSNTDIIKTVLYTFTNKDKILHRDGSLLFHFPYFKNTFWTNFKYNTSLNPEHIRLGIILITNDRYEYTILDNQLRDNNVWYHTRWSFPSLHTDKTHSGIYIKVESDFIPDDFVLELQGFVDLFPDVENYLLMNENNVYEFSCSNYIGTELINPCSSIFNVENYEYIRDILPKAITIYTISSYL